MISFGDNIINDIHYQGYKIIKVYACDGELVFDNTTPPPPPPVGNKLVYSISGNTYYIPCTTSSTLTLGEIVADLVAHGYRMAFSAVTDAVIGDCVTTLDNDCFNGGRSITSVTIPNSVTSIGEGAFYHNFSLSSITIPSSVTHIGGGAFEQCSMLSSVTIPSSITSIEVETFDDCYRLREVIIPSSVTSIGSSAFYIEESSIPSEDAAARETLSGRQVYCYAEVPPTLGTNAFDTNYHSLQATYPIYVPSASVDTYKSAWSTYASRIQAIP